MDQSLNPFGVYDSIWDSGRVPSNWKRIKGRTKKVKVKRADITRLLQSKIPGKWKKVYSYGVDGSEVHYFEHTATGKVWRVSFFPAQ